MKTYLLGCTRRAKKGLSGYWSLLVQRVGVAGNRLVTYSDDSLRGVRDGG